MKEKEVNITLVTTQSDGSEKQTMELFTKGRFSKNILGYVVSYEESEATGYEGSTTSLTIFDGNAKVEMQRTGASGSQLILEKGKKHFCRYGTPFGDFTVGVYASDIKSDLSDDGGTVRFNYVLDINASYIGDYEVVVTVGS